jgi:hypothetical protein
MDIVNESTLVSHPILLRVIQSINKAIPDVCAIWNKPQIQVSWKKKSKNSDCLVITDCNNPPMYGYHCYTNAYAFGRVYINSQNLEKLSIILSHEVFEMIVNPKMSASPEGIFKEVSDPVMEDFYDVDGVLISDWVYPSWFSPSGTYPFNKLGTLKKPFEIAKGGYILKTN